MRDVDQNLHFRLLAARSMNPTPYFAEVCIVAWTLMVHERQYKLGPNKVTIAQGGKELVLTVIQRQSRAADGYAMAIAGHTREGFIVQNSRGCPRT